jgi:hypothetical protein
VEVTTRVAEIFARLESAVGGAVSDPDGRAVRTSFGWAAGGPETDIRTLTERADAGLLGRKAARPRRTPR